MIRALYSSASSMAAQQQSMDVISNNIANVNTVGYKKVRVTFQDALYSAMETRRDGQGVNLQVGNGSRAAATQRNFGQGVLQPTNRPLDFAIDGPGFFQILRQDGSVSYTRDGSFQISSELEGDQVVNRLVTVRGEYVLDHSGQPVEVDDYYSLPYRLRVVSFPNPEGLEAIGNNQFIGTEASGVPVPSYNYDVKQGFLEASNVDMAEEITRMILAQRVYQLSSRVLQAADEMEHIANNLRR
ncbi:MAG: flagellar hook-basal body protein [Caldicoprobacteraceae bacterium]|jgi:flagellar basal-body rod protein FlgG